MEIRLEAHGKARGSSENERREHCGWGSRCAHVKSLVHIVVRRTVDTVHQRAADNNSDLHHVGKQRLNRHAPAA